MKKFIPLFLFLFFSVFLISSAQTLDWKWGVGAIGTLGDDNNGLEIRTGKNGNVFVLGRFSDDSLTIGSFTIHRKTFYSSIPNNYFVVKYDSLGNALMLKNLGVGNFDGVVFNIDNSNNFYVSGSFYQDSAVVGNDTLYQRNPGYDHGIFIAKFDLNGNPIWVRSNNNDGYFSSNRLVVDDDYNVYVFGSCSNSDSISFNSKTIIINDSASHLFFVKFDSSGTPLMIKSIDANSHGVLILGGADAIDIKIDTKKNIIITGSFSAPFLAFDTIILYNSHPPGWWTDIYIAKFDSSGNVLWAKSYGSISSQSVGRKLLLDSMDNIYLSGGYNGDIFFDTIFVPGGGCFLLKQDKNGNIKWLKSNIPLISGMAWGPDQSILGAGFFSGDSIVILSTTIYNDTAHIFGTVTKKLLLTQYDTSGNIIWIMTGDGFALARDIAATPEKDFYITGEYWFDSLVLGPILINSNQSYYTTFTAKVGNNVNTIFETSINKHITIYPNPFHSTTNIFVSDNIIIGHKMFVYDCQGNIVRGLIVEGTRTQFERMNLPSGIYFYSIINSKGKSESGKFIIQ